MPPRPERPESVEHTDSVGKIGAAGDIGSTAGIEKIVGPGPVRTCVGCRGRAAQTELLRVVLVNGQASPDPRRRLPGRGAYVHPDASCAATARKRRVWQRALRAPGPVDPTPVEEALKSSA